MSAHVQHASVFSGRSLTFMAVMGLHALVISALIVMKFVPPLINKEPGSIEVIPVQPPEIVPPAPQPIPLTPLKLIIAVPTVLPPDINMPEDTQVAEVSSPPETYSGPMTIDAGPAAGPEIAAPAARLFRELQYRAVMSPDAFYPTTSVALQEQGVSIVSVCVNAAGQIDGVPTIHTSSGYKRLDQAAIRWTREALRFTPASENGVGVRACKGFRVVFDLN